MQTGWLVRVPQTEQALLQRRHSARQLLLNEMEDKDCRGEMAAGGEFQGMHLFGWNNAKVCKSNVDHA